MLKSIRAIYENASENNINNREFQKYIKLLTRDEINICKFCSKHTQGKLLANTWVCYSCILIFNEE